MNSGPKAFTINAMDNLSLDCFIPSNLVNLDANVLFIGNLKNRAFSSKLNISDIFIWRFWFTHFKL
jgi:hypothetical protein